jgi:hypothetical protein
MNIFLYSPTTADTAFWRNVSPNTQICENLSYASGNVHCAQTQSTHIASCVTVHVTASSKQLLINGCVKWLHNICNMDRDGDTPTANTSLKTTDTNYPDTTHDSIKFTILPNMSTNSKDFPSKPTSNGGPFPSCKHTNIMDIWFLSGCVHMHGEQGRNAAYFN